MYMMYACVCMFCLKYHETNFSKCQCLKYFRISSYHEKILEHYRDSTCYEKQKIDVVFIFSHFFKHFSVLVNRLNEVQLHALAVELLRRQPAVYADIANGELRVGVPVREPEREPLPGPEHNNPELGDHEPDPGPPNEEIPDWCKCQNCRPMPTAGLQISNPFEK